MAAPVTSISPGGLPTKYSKSFAYDVRDYIQPDPIGFSIPASSASFATWANGTTALTAGVSKQFVSYGGCGHRQFGSRGRRLLDGHAHHKPILQLQRPELPYRGLLLDCGVHGSSGLAGTQTSTGSSVFTFTGTGANTTGTSTTATDTGHAAFPAIGTNLPIYNPYVSVIDGGTCTVICRGPGGTWTNTAYVFPTGPNGGLTVGPGDIFQLAKGTDTSAVYVGEAEFTFTPGTSFTV